jgi:WD40 repeat protein
VYLLEVLSAAVSPDGRLALTGSDSGTVAVWDLATGEQLRLLKGHRWAVTSVAVSPDGRLALTGSEYGTAAVWDLENGEQLYEFEGSGDTVPSAAVSPDGRLALTGSDRGTTVWDLRTGQSLTTLSLDSPVRCVVWAPNGRSFLAGDDGGNLYCLGYRER